MKGSILTPFAAPRGLKTALCTPTTRWWMALEADIAMKGSVNLVRRDLNMEAVVAPEISATVGVAAAFAVNPIVGAAVFAASKVLGPLWSKVSILRYHISGPLDDPQINEVLRQPRKEKAQ